MEPFIRLTAIAAPIELRNVNTDMIFPARFMRKPRDENYPLYMFHDRRFRPDGTEDPDFVLNQPAYQGARIIVGNANFGCGSSREPAVYALHDYGFRALIAPGFGDIFAANCVKNGLLAVRLADADVDGLRALVSETPGTEITIDLPSQTVVAPGIEPLSFEIDPFEKECLSSGLDDIGVTLRDEDTIAAFEQTYRGDFDWLYGKRGGGRG